MSPKIIWLEVDRYLSIGVPEDGEFIDSEARLVTETYGYPVFAWRPTLCRNGRIRWLCWLERMADGAFIKARGG